jgi:hypothetical protein
MLELVTHHWAEIFTSRKMASGSYVRIPDLDLLQKGSFMQQFGTGHIERKPECKWSSPRSN